jgi:YidC/Oxa1 family membrane protein insertase
MDRNSIIGIVLIAGILIVYSIISKPSRERVLEQKRIADSLQVAQERAAVENKTFDSTKIISDSARTNEPDLQRNYGIYASHASGTEQLYTIENDVIELTLS